MARRPERIREVSGERWRVPLFPEETGRQHGVFAAACTTPTVRRPDCAMLGQTVLQIVQRCVQHDFLENLQVI